MAEQNKWEGLQELLLQSVDVDSESPGRVTPLMMAAEAGQADAVRALITAGAGVNKTNGYSSSVLWYGRRGGIRILKMLLEGGADVNKPSSKGGWTVLMDAVTEGDMDQVQLLLQFGADVCQQDDYERSCLSIAAGLQNCAVATEMVLRLLKAGADPTVTNYQAPYSTQERPFVTAADIARYTGKESLANLLQSRQEEWERPFVLTVTAAPAADVIELTCRAISGNVAATLHWPQTAKNYKLKEAICTAVVEAGFDCPIKPLRVCNLRLVKPDATMLRLGGRDPPVAEQLLGTASAVAQDFLCGHSKQ